jgi:hypothetical protein
VTTSTPRGVAIIAGEEKRLGVSGKTENFFKWQVLLMILWMKREWALTKTIGHTPECHMEGKDLFNKLPNR